MALGLTALLLLLAQSAQGQNNRSTITNSATAKSARATTSLIANARAVAEGLKLQGAEQDNIGSLKSYGAPSTRETIEHALEPHTLFLVHINPEMRVKVSPGGAKSELVTSEWTLFLARIENESSTTAPLQISVLSPANVAPPAAWLEAELVTQTNLPVTLSGAPLEYRLVKLRSREPGLREARISLHVGQGTQDLGFRNEVDILFKCGAAPTSQSQTNSNK